MTVRELAPQLSPGWQLADDAPLTQPVVVSLRPYQIEAAEAVMSSWQEGHRHVLVSPPTGTGKTEIGLEVAGRVWTGKERVLIIAHRRELVAEPIERLIRRYPLMSLYTGKVQGPHNDLDKPIISASIQTLRNRIQDLLGHGPIDMVWVDEAHHVHASTYRYVLRQLLQANPQLRHMGTTATPYRADGQRMVGRRAPYKHMAFFREIPWAMKNGHICPLSPLAVHVDWDTSDIRTVGGDFDTAALTGLLDATNWAEVVMETWLDTAPDRQTIAFTVTIEHAQHLTALFQGAGVAAEAISGRLSADERRRRVVAYLRGDLQVLINCNVLTEGFDAPQTSCLLLARPTRSRGLYIQMIGRGTRKHQGKENCLLIDFCGNGGDQSVIGWNYLFGHDLEDEGTVTANRPMSPDITQEEMTTLRPAEQPQPGAPVRVFRCVAGLLGKSTQAFWTDLRTFEVSLSLGPRAEAEGERRTNRVLYLAAPLSQEQLSSLDGRIERGKAFCAANPHHSWARGLLAYLSHRQRHADQYTLLLIDVEARRATVLEAGLDFNWLVDMAEAYAIQFGSDVITTRGAGWRKALPSKDQLDYITRFGLPPELLNYLDRGTASQIIAHYKARDVLETLGCR